MFVIKNCKGFEPGRVSPLKKQCGTLFLGERAERTKRGQIAFAAGKGGNPEPRLDDLLGVCALSICPWQISAAKRLCCSATSPPGKQLLLYVTAVFVCNKNCKGFVAGKFMGDVLTQGGLFSGRVQIGWVCDSSYLWYSE